MSVPYRRARHAARTVHSSIFSLQPLTPSQPTHAAPPRRRQRAATEPLERRLLLTRFAVIGDLGDNSKLADVSAMVKSWDPAHIVTVGDNDNINHTRYDDTVGKYFHEWVSPYLGSHGAGSSSGNRFWPAMGNHDWESSTGSRKYTDYFTLPGVERYYSKKLDDVEFFMYDSDTREPHGTSGSSTQGTWLRSALGSSTAKWKVVIVHHPPYSSGTEPEATWVRLPFKDWGATAVLSGHQHHYERLNVSGTPYIVVAPAGATTGGGWGSIDSRSVVRYNADHGAMMIDSGDSAITFRFFNRSGTLIDSHTVSAPAAPSGSNVTFINTGATWKYLDNGSNQGTAWRELGFNDSTWKSGVAELGYGDGDEETVVSYGGSSSNKYITTYFRKSFDVPDASLVSALNMRVKRDDGVVVYLNGSEVYRNNMPTGTISYNTRASSAIEQNSFFTSTISTASLRSGQNVIAVSIHQDGPTSSDISFDLELTGSVAGSITSPAAPGNLSASAVSFSQINLAWSDNSSNESGFRIERSTDGSSFAQIATVAAGATSYNDTGRASGTKYYYRVRAYNSAGNSSYSNTASATTSSGSGSTTVYLSDVEWVSATNGWGPVERDSGNGSSGAGDGAPITLNGVVYPKGLGAHAHSVIVYNLGGAYDTFASDIGVDDRQTTNGSIVFQVFLDGSKAYDSGVMRATSATKTINLSVAGVNELRLVITDAGDGINYDHGDWAAARLTRSSGSGLVMMTDSEATIVESPLRRDLLELLE